MDLFSGLGGFAYAATQVWGARYHNILFCDNNKFCIEVIKKNFGKDSIIYGDIKEVTMSRFIADADIRHNKRTEREIRLGCQFIDGNIDLLTAGVPCQPASCAGRRKGTHDDRWLWPETFRIIREFKPTWCVLENVRGLVSLERGLVFDALLAELEAMGYEVAPPFIIPAVAVNAPHRRDRVWIIAKSTTEGQQERQQPPDVANGPEIKAGMGIRPERGDCNVTNPECCQRTQCGDTSGMGWKGKPLPWNKTSWLAVAAELCRVDDGTSVRLDTLNLSAAGHRIERLRALGNAIVPAIAIEIFKAIKATEDSEQVTMSSEH